MTLTAADFPAFYQQVHGYRPFSWQSTLVSTLLEQRTWKELVDVPTGLGKTSLLDIAVFVAATTSGDDPATRVGRRRIFFVVDRRIVVDEAHERALKIAAALEQALSDDAESVVKEVARGLQKYISSDAASLADGLASTDDPVAEGDPAGQGQPSHPPLSVTRMRGGVTWADVWLDRPDLPAIVVGTVDQVGSRLLFRGYGVSDRRKSMDAALVGTDSLILVDEAHLATALISTERQLSAQDPGRLDVAGRTVVRLTATPGEDNANAFRFEVDDHRDDPIAMRRLTAPKHVRLAEALPKTIAREMAQLTHELLDGDRRTALVVCNTVDRARAVFEEVRKGATGEPAVSVDLLIGRSRPVDREYTVARIMTKFGFGRSRQEDDARAILVATQTVEVGANLDADVLITESAPWDSLVQRWGRLNRAGECPGGGISVVVHDGVADLVYGDARLAAWDHLVRTIADADHMDASPLTLRAESHMPPAEALSARPVGPIVVRPILDCWAQTGPIPEPDIPVAQYLHGLENEAVSVSIAWRAGLVLPEESGFVDVFDPGVLRERGQDAVNAVLTAVPVHAAEQVEVPINTARRWMRGEIVPPLSDLEADDPGVSDRSEAGFRGLVWRTEATSEGVATSRLRRPQGCWRWVTADQLQSGDVVVVPVERGGLDQYGWAPGSRRTVTDVAEVTRFAVDGQLGKQRPLLRIDQWTSDRLGADGHRPRALADPILSRLSEWVGEDAVDVRSVASAVSAVVAGLLTAAADTPDGERIPGSAWSPGRLRMLHEWLQKRNLQLSPVEIPEAVVSGSELPAQWTDYVLSTKATSVSHRDDERSEGSSYASGPVSLSRHHRNVGHRARAVADALGLSDQVRISVEVAASWHDIGKCEPRFQAMLCGGNEYDALLLEEPLAKSGMDPMAGPAAFRIARQRSRLPGGARHEAWSASLVAERLRDYQGADIDVNLVLHLVASHHGRSRPWLPFVVDDDPTEIQALLVGPDGDQKITVSSEQMVDTDHPARFARLNSQYGYWGLALLECVVRSADITVSQEGS